MRYIQTLCAVVLVTLVAQSSVALEFNFRPEPGMDQAAIDGFEAAGALWSKLFNDNITIVMDIGFRNLGGGILGETGSDRTRVTYQQFRTAMTTDRSSNDDRTAVASLGAGAALAILLNRTSNSPHGPSNAQPFLDNDGDANNTTIDLTRANAKALGLLPGNATGRDANITFNSQFNWDFDPNDGVDPNSFNFVFVAAHEIGHALGFVSGVDVLDGNSPPVNGPFADHEFVFVSSVDVFRFSTQSVAQGLGTIDWTADTRRKYFSTDGGTTDLGGFSTGRNFGDGQQNSHWKDNLNLGIMDPTAAPGEMGEITALDRQLFDVIGYNSADGDGNRFCRNVAVSIPDSDPTGVTDTLVVTATGTLSDLNVELVVTHTWVGDLVIGLRHEETNKQVTLLDRIGRSGTGFGCGRDDIDATLDDAGTGPVESVCFPSVPSIAGTFRPEQSLQAFVGDTLSGTWTLTLSDHASQDLGSLVSWCLVGERSIAGPAVAQETSEKRQYTDTEKEFERQLQEVQKQYPLVAKSFAFLQELHRFCIVDHICFKQVQDHCLRQGLPPKFCLDSADRVCCKPLEIFQQSR